MEPWSGLGRRVATYAFYRIAGLLWAATLAANEPVISWPADMPRVGSAIVGPSPTIMLSNSFFPLELASVEPPNIVFTGPMLPPAVARLSSAPFLMRGGVAVTGVPLSPSDAVLNVEPELAAWLAAAGDGGHVVYLSLGTVFSVRDERIVAVVRAMLDSGARVVWKTSRSAFNDVAAMLVTAGVAPASARTSPGGSGSSGGATDVIVTPSLYVTSWVLDQLALMQHSAVTLFLSHCGTNSVYESIAAGLPIFCLPFGSSQVHMSIMLGRTGVSKGTIDLYSPSLYNDTATLMRYAVGCCLTI